MAGDALLQEFARIVNSQIRKGVDSSYRYGGDEFAVILSDAGDESCQKIGKRVSDIFEKTSGECVSIGYAFFSEEMTPEALVIKADMNLYKYKGLKNGSITAKRQA